jgi:hypothetical protein
MNFFKAITIIAILAVSQISFAQQTPDIDKEFQKSIEQMSEIMKDLDFNKLLNEELFGKIEELKPSEQQLESMGSMMEQSLKSLETIDFSGLQDLMSNIEPMMKELEGTMKGLEGSMKGLEGMMKDLESEMPNISKPSNKSSKSKGKQI